MALRKAPGCDGLPAEFYFKIWDVLVLNFCYLSGLCHVLNVAASYLSTQRGL